MIMIVIVVVILVVIVVVIMIVVAIAIVLVVVVMTIKLIITTLFRCQVRLLAGKRSTNCEHHLYQPVYHLQMLEQR